AGTELADGDEAARIIDVARKRQARADQTICVTLGKRGVLALAGREEIAVPGRAVNAVDTTGAGDCFVGALAACLADGAALPAALAFANAAASISVQRMGAGPSMPTAKEVKAVL
ncbi:PfkB family carbohydrate kinase, partial [Bradyrhizobium cajani]|uniref:PfkB family carbohydrate kinase n=1 Tax=Bradyrhizobium cajani TaxID=1928661 RepID=UPI0020B21A5D